MTTIDTTKADATARRAESATYSPADQERLARFALIAAYHAARGEHVDAGLWGGRQRRESDKFGVVVTVADDAPLPSDEEVARWKAEVEANDQAQRLRAIEAHHAAEAVEVARAEADGLGNDPYVRNLRRRADYHRRQIPRLRRHVVQLCGARIRYGRAARPATNVRERGSRRSRAGSRSGSSRAGPSESDDDAPGKARSNDGLTPYAAALAAEFQAASDALIARWRAERGDDQLDLFRGPA